MFHAPRTPLFLHTGAPPEPGTPAGGGLRSMLAHWMGGAAAGAVIGPTGGAGFVSLMGLWMGGRTGAGAGAGVVSGGGIYVPRFRRRTR